MPDMPKAADDAEAECQNGDIVQNDDKPKAAQDKSYYYDDAHGYEDFDPDERDDEED